MEEKLTNILENYNEKHIKNMNEKISGVFIYGIITGIILSYTGFLGFITGICTGLIITKKYNYISNQITLKIVDLYTNMIDKIK